MATSVTNVSLNSTNRMAKSKTKKMMIVSPTMKTIEKTLFLGLLYFIQGFPYGFQDKLIPLVLIVKGHSPSTITIIRLLLLPWLAKALFAPLIDMTLSLTKWVCITLIGLICISLLNAIWPDLTIHSTETGHISHQFIITLFLLNFLSAFQDIAVDAIAVNIYSDDRDIIQANTGQVVGYKLGAFFGSGILFWIYSLFDWNGLFGSLALIYTIVLFIFNTYSKYLQSSTSANNQNSNDHSNDKFLMTTTNNNRRYEQTTPKTKTTTKTTMLKARIILKNGASSVMNQVYHWFMNDTDQTSAKISYLNNDVIFDANHQPSNEDFRHQTDKQGDKVDDDHDDDQHGDLSIKKTESTIRTSPFDVFIYVFLYKLGESGAMATYPFFMAMNCAMESHHIAFWNGTIGALCSILGSIMASRFSFSISILSKMIKFRLLPLVLQLVCMILVFTANQANNMTTEPSTTGNFSTSQILYYVSLLSMLSLHLIGGLVTTMTFTLMMMTCQTKRITRNNHEKTTTMPADNNSFGATRYTLLSTIEVLGKLILSSLSGTIVERFGFIGAQVLFLILSILPIYILNNDNKTKTKDKAF